MSDALPYRFPADRVRQPPSPVKQKRRGTISSGTRSARACIPCRERHCACDNGEPICGACQAKPHRDLECEYGHSPQFSTKAGRRKSDASAPTLLLSSSSLSSAIKSTSIQPQTPRPSIDRAWSDVPRARVNTAPQFSSYPPPAATSSAFLGSSPTRHLSIRTDVHVNQYHYDGLETPLSASPWTAYGSTEPTSAHSVDAVALEPVVEATSYGTTAPLAVPGAPEGQGQVVAPVAASAAGAFGSAQRSFQALAVHDGLRAHYQSFGAGMSVAERVSMEALIGGSAKVLASLHELSGTLASQASTPQ
ncbi:hypothetical protein JCM3775_001541 [Rhodotorula graminis]